MRLRIISPRKKLKGGLIICRLMFQWGVKISSNFLVIIRLVRNWHIFKRLIVKMNIMIKTKKFFKSRVQEIEASNLIFLDRLKIWLLKDLLWSLTS